MTRPKRRTAAELIALVREHGPGALDNMEWLDELADYTAAAAFLGVDERTLRTEAGKTNADGSRKLPAPARRFGRSPTWTLRSLVLNRAARPGRGGKGIPRKPRAPS